MRERTFLFLGSQIQLTKSVRDIAVGKWVRVPPHTESDPGAGEVGELILCLFGTFMFWLDVGY